jgi:hypothetical protein
MFIGRVLELLATRLFLVLRAFGKATFFKLLVLPKALVPLDAKTVLESPFYPRESIFYTILHQNDATKNDSSSASG